MNENGKPIFDKPLRVLPVLPDRISSDVEEWRCEAWQRLDSRIKLSDITDRMHPRFRIPKNTLQQRNGRFRTQFNMIAWHSGNKKSMFLEQQLEEKLRASGIDPALNSTRGLTPGLINPALGEAGGRIPLPGKHGPKASRPPKGKAASIEHHLQGQDVMEFAANAQIQVPIPAADFQMPVPESQTNLPVSVADVKMSNPVKPRRRVKISKETTKQNLMAAGYWAASYVHQTNAPVSATNFQMPSPQEHYPNTPVLAADIQMPTPESQTNVPFSIADVQIPTPNKPRRRVRPSHEEIWIQNLMDEGYLPASYLTQTNVSVADVQMSTPNKPRRQGKLNRQEILKQELMAAGYWPASYLLQANVPVWAADNAPATLNTQGQTDDIMWDEWLTF